MQPLLMIKTVPAQDRPDRLLVRTPPEPVRPASPARCVQALLALVDRPGSPRWACTAWCCDLVGPVRSVARVSDDGDSSRAGLESLLARLDPEEARTVLPEWVGQPSADVDVLLSLGVASGKPGRAVVVDIPEEAAGLVLDLGDGTTRFSYPAWTGDPVTSDGRLLALQTLVRWRSGHNVGPADIMTKPAPDGGGAADLVHNGSATAIMDKNDLAAAVRTLVSWVCGPGRGFVGCWAWSRGLPETKTPQARAALPEMTRCVVEDVVRQVMS